MGDKLDLSSPQFRKELINTMIQSTPVAYVMIDRSNTVRYVNDHFLRYRKLEKADVLGEICYRASAVKDGVCPKCIVREAADTGRPSGLMRKDVLHDGTITYSDDFAVPIKDKDTGDFNYVLEVMIDRTKEMQLRERNNAVFLEIVNAMIKLLEKKDYYTSLHSRNVSAISAKMTDFLGLGERAVFNAALGGLLHDLGKLYIPDHILKKPAKLDDKEYGVMKEHPMFTWLLLTGMASFNSLRDIAIAHHEKWDGTGYPSGLKGADIPVEARITAIADTYDSMTSTRPYRKALDHETAMREIQKHAGTQFDRRLVDEFVRMVEERGMGREDLISHTDLVGALDDSGLTQYVHRERDRDREAPPQETTLETKNLQAVMQSGSFIESVFDNTPAFYTLVDDSFNVLYVSDNLVAATGRPFEELLMGKCFDMTDKKMQCFKMENGAVLCPIIRAFGTGKEQYALLEEDFEGRKLYFDVFGIPLELQAAGGGTIKCCLEIMFDRTREKTIQHTFEADLKKLIVKLRDMMEEILPEVSGNIHEIVSEASSFGEYLNQIYNGLSELVSTSAPRGAGGSEGGAAGR